MAAAEEKIGCRLWVLQGGDGHNQGVPEKRTNGARYEEIQGDLIKKVVDIANRCRH